MRRLVPWFVAAVVVAAPSVSHAAASLRVSLSAEQAQVGEGIRVELSAMSDGDEPSSPRLRAPPGFNVQGPSVGSSQSFSLANGHFQHQRGITATWIVMATRPGRFVIGPAMVQVGAKTQQSETATVEILAPGTMPRRPQRNPADPFDMDPFFSQMPKLPGIRGIPGLPNLDDLENELHGIVPELPPEYAVEHAPEQMAFLRATAAPRDVVVGEQVTLRVYAYGGNGPYDEVGAAEPSRADFLSQVIIDSSYRQPRYVTEIDGTRWTAVKLREVALFALHAGDLTIGPMTMGFRGPGYPENSALQGLIRSSKEIHINVHEPPMAGRPPGYELGNVGAYSLSSAVEPRSVVAGDAVAVTIRLEGTGNVPHDVKIPEQKGVDWLDPSIDDAVADHSGAVGGSRTFRYVVRLDEPGTHDLGEVTLPFYDARTKKYEIARTQLGSVEVKPGKAVAPVVSAAAPSASTEGPLQDLGAPRRALGAPAVTPRHFTDSKGFFGLLGGGPLAVIALGGLAELVARLRRRMAARDRSLTSASRRALGEARAAAARGEKAAVAGAVERALYTAVEDRLGLKARAVLRPELSQKLVKAGAEPELASEIVALLDACDGLRFSSSDASEAKSAIERVARVIAQLPRAAHQSVPEQAG